MYPDLPSAFVAEASTLLILLAGAVLLYRSFREKYLVPWIIGWVIYTASRLFLTISVSYSSDAIWAILANSSFVISTGLFSIAVFYYVYRPKLVRPAIVMTGLAVLLGIAQAKWPAHGTTLSWAFWVCWRLVTVMASVQAAMFARGRGIVGTWLLSLMLLFVHMDSGAQSHAVADYDFVIDLLLGISMMMIVLDDSRVQVARAEVLNRLSLVVANADEFQPIVENTLDELVRSAGARGAWFRTLDEDGKLRLSAVNGMPDSFVEYSSEVDNATAITRDLLSAGEVGILPVPSVQPERRRQLEHLGINHIVLIPVLGKSSQIGVLVLGMRRHRGYTENDRIFLKAAANQLGLAAENRRLLQQLVHSRNEWASTFSSIPDYILVHDSQYRILRANRALLDRLKRPYAGVVMQTCETVLPGGGRNWTTCPYCDPAALVAEHDPCFGGYSVVSTSAYSGQDSAGGTVHVIKDVTDIRTAEERYKGLFDHMHEGVFVSSPAGKILDCNEAFVRMFGYGSKDELLQLDAAEMLYVNMEDRRKFQEQMAEQGFVRSFEYELRRKDGKQITVVESSFATRNSSGAIERYQGVMLDVTEQKRVEDEIRRRNRELYALNSIAVTFNQSFNLDEILQLTLFQIVELFSTDTAGIFLFDEATQSLRRMAGHGHRSDWIAKTDVFPLPAEFIETIKNQHVEILAHRDIGAMPEIIRRYVEEENLTSWIWMVLWRKDKILGILGTSSRVPREFSASDESVMIAVGRQLATTIDRIHLYEETRKAYEDLRRTQEQLLQSEKMSAVGQLVSGVAHELNNPLTAIIGYTQLLENEKNEQQVHEYIQKLNKQSQRAHKIVQNLLSFARQQKPQRIHVDLRNVMEETIGLRDYELKAHRIRVERDFQQGLPSVMADPHQLEQVFLNIINNSTDAILEGAAGGVLNVRITSENGSVVTEFHDSGPGMNDPKRVFDPFYTTKGIGKGTGLGLSICYGIVKEHGGEITAQNHPAGGAVVRVRLPVAVGQKPITEEERIAARRETKLTGRVLLVESKEAALGFEREVLVAAGLQVLALNSKNNALEKLQQEAFDMVVLDSQLNGACNCDDVLCWMRGSQSDLIAKTILVVANIAEPGMDVLKHASNVICLVKPYGVSDLLGVVRRVLRTAKAATAN